MKRLNLVAAAGLLSMVFAASITGTAQTLTTLVEFDGSNGGSPYFATLVQDTNGNVYGTTLQGGANGLGTIFQVTAEGEFSTLYNFCSQANCADGGVPYAGLAHDAEGNLYGTTSQFGANFDGTVFEITPEGVLTTLYNFCSQANCTDGSYPYGGVVYFAGNLYGTTSSGGSNGDGTIFKLTLGGQLTTLHSFCSQANCADGYSVYDAMIEANGKLWGTTQQGGSNGFGTVFSITPGGKFKSLHSFNSIDGSTPFGGPVHAANGNFYGTTSDGGDRDDGTVFKMTTSGKLTTIYNFCADPDCPDGVAPLGGLAQGSNGNFYGTTADGGANFRGTIFEITPAGELTTLYSFCSKTDCADGDYPYTGVVQATDEKLYGTTYGGGDLNCASPGGCGTVFSLTEESSDRQLPKLGYNSSASIQNERRSGGPGATISAGSTVPAERTPF
jgi:uncharacterized repeat protein (TIGR03803 family)